MGTLDTVSTCSLLPVSVLQNRRALSSDCPAAKPLASARHKKPAGGTGCLAGGGLGGSYVLQGNATKPPNPSPLFAISVIGCVKNCCPRSYGHICVLFNPPMLLLQPRGENRLNYPNLCNNAVVILCSTHLREHHGAYCRYFSCACSRCLLK